MGFSGTTVSRDSAVNGVEKKNPGSCISADGNTLREVLEENGQAV